jgi:SAM-dependent methyltransferase
MKLSERKFIPPPEFIEGEPMYLVPFLPSPKKVVKEALKLADLKEGEVLVDLGSGDGRVLIEAAKLGAYAVGIEIDDKLIAKAKMKVEKEGLKDKVYITKGDLFRFDYVRNADVIYMFLDKESMKLVKKLLIENAKNGARVISITYPIPGWEPKAKKVIKGFLESRTLYLYVIEKEEPHEAEAVKDSEKPKVSPTTKIKQEPAKKEMEDDYLKQVLKLLNSIATNYGLSNTETLTVREIYLKIKDDVGNDLRRILEELVDVYERVVYGKPDPTDVERLRKLLDTAKNYMP